MVSGIIVRSADGITTMHNRYCHTFAGDHVRIDDGHALGAEHVGDGALAGRNATGDGDNEHVVRELRIYGFRCGCTCGALATGAEVPTAEICQRWQIFCGCAQLIFG